MHGILVCVHMSGGKAPRTFKRRTRTPDEQDAVGFLNEGSSSNNQLSIVGPTASWTDLSLSVVDDATAKAAATGDAEGRNQCRYRQKDTSPSVT
jgi:hypothetical protein